MPIAAIDKNKSDKFGRKYGNIYRMVWKGEREGRNDVIIL